MTLNKSRIVQQSFNLYHRENIKHYSILLSRTGSQTDQGRTDPLMSFCLQSNAPIPGKMARQEISSLE